MRIGSKLGAAVLFFGAFAFWGCADQRQTVDLQPYLWAGLQPLSSTADFAYVFKIPPGRTVEIVLPALCLDFSKDTPSTISQFKARPEMVSEDVRELFMLNRLMVNNLEAFRDYFRRIPELEILAQEEHMLRASGGKQEMVQYLLKASLDEALQRAIWQDDPSSGDDYRDLQNQRRRQAQGIRSLIDDTKSGMPVEEVIKQLHRIDPSPEGLADPSVTSGISRGELVDTLELSLQRILLKNRWDAAVETLGELMYRSRIPDA